MARRSQKAVLAEKRKRRGAGMSVEAWFKYIVIFVGVLVLIGVLLSLVKP